MENAVELVVRNPRGEIEARRKYAPAPRLKNLSGKRFVLIHNNKNGAPTFLDEVQKLLHEKYPTATFLRQYTTQPNLANPPAFYDEVAKVGDAFIFGAGD
jgi:hypothetical protein